MKIGVTDACTDFRGLTKDTYSKIRPPASTFVSESPEYTFVSDRLLIGSCIGYSQVMPKYVWPDKREEPPHWEVILWALNF